LRKLKLQELQRVRPDVYQSMDKIPVIVVLDNIRSGLNIGSIFRTADAFLIEKIILTGISPIPPHREILKTAIGATDTVLWEYKKDIQIAVEELKSNKYQVYAIEQTSESIPLHTIDSLDLSRVALVFGNEVNGVSESILDLIDGAIEIEQFGTKHSLNVAVCAGMVIWAFFQQMKMKLSPGGICDKRKIWRNFLQKL